MTARSRRSNLQGRVEALLGRYSRLIYCCGSMRISSKWRHRDLTTVYHGVFWVHHGGQNVTINMFYQEPRTLTSLNMSKNIGKAKIRGDRTFPLLKSTKRPADDSFVHSLCFSTRKTHKTRPEQNKRHPSDANCWFIVVYSLKINRDIPMASCRVRKFTMVLGTVWWTTSCQPY